MAQNDQLKQYLDAGMQFTQMTQQRAEAIVKDFIAAGEVQAEQLQAALADLVERSRKNTEQFVELIRTEIQNQIKALGLATQDDIARIEAKLAKVTAAGNGSASTVAKKAAAKKAPVKKAAAKKA